MDKAYSKGERS